jgi:hypothetical protein
MTDERNTNKNITISIPRDLYDRLKQLRPEKRRENVPDFMSEIFLVGWNEIERRTLFHQLQAADTLLPPERGSIH